MWLSPKRSLSRGKSVRSEPPVFALEAVVLLFLRQSEARLWISPDALLLERVSWLVGQ